MHPMPTVYTHGGGAVKNESDSACVEIFGKGGRRDGFEDGDEFA